jgi:multiple sugar transport system substrate-binding protein
MRKHFAGIITAVGVALAVGATTFSPATAATKKKTTTKKPTTTTAAPTTAAAPTTVAAPKNLDVTMLSTQFAPLEEAENMRKQILKDYKGKAEFIPTDQVAFAARVEAEGKSGNGKVDVVAGLIGDLAPQTKYLRDLSALKSQVAFAKIPESVWELGKLGTDKQLCVPWISATLVMVVNKQALQYLPPAYDINNLSHTQFVTWMGNMEAKTGKRRLGFAGGNSGLIHRYFQGYLLPSYTKAVNTKWSSDEAVQAWDSMQELWDYTNQQSTTYNFMQDPLQSGEVWVAIDHVARIKDAVVNKPNDYVVVPVPSGPKGRSYMAIIGCVGVMSSSANAGGAEELIKYLVTPETSSATLRLNGFYPPGEVDLPGELSPGLKLVTKGIDTMRNSKGAFATLIPGGLGAKNGDYNRIWRETFTAIVLQKKDIKETLNDARPKLQTVFNDAKAPCWFPDPPSGDKPCQVG